jgi:hypothetical protein
MIVGRYVIPMIRACCLALLLAVLGSSSSTAASPVPELSVSDATVVEGDGAAHAVFTVRLSRPSRQTVRVRYATTNGSATAGEDYVADRGTLTFRPRQRSKTVAVSILGDSVPEGDETFFVRVFAPVNVRIAKQRATGLIRANDLPSPFTLSATMDGEQVVGPPAPGTTGAQGTFSATVSPAEERLSFTLVIEGMDERIFAVHVHKAARGEFGLEHLVDLDPFPAQNGSATGVKRMSLERILAVFNDPTSYYVEVHPADLSGGIRGQLARP